MTEIAFRGFVIAIEADTPHRLGNEAVHLFFGRGSGIVNCGVYLGRDEARELGQAIIAEVDRSESGDS